LLALFCLSQQIEQQKAQKKHKHKKKKKHKKNDSSSDDDDDLLRQYLSIVNRKKSAETPSQKQEHSSPDNIEDKLRQSSDGLQHHKHQRSTSHSDRVEDKTQHAHHRFPDNDKHADRHQQKTTHGSGSVDNSKRKHSRQSHDDSDRDKSTRDRCGHVHDKCYRDGTKSKRRQSGDTDGHNSCDGQNFHSKHQSKDMHRRRSLEAEKETTESVHRTRYRSSSGDERPDSSREKVAGYGLVVSWKLFVLQP